MTESRVLKFRNRRDAEEALAKVRAVEDRDDVVWRVHDQSELVQHPEFLVLGYRDGVIWDTL
jgi:hypothetical protein